MDDFLAGVDALGEDINYRNTVMSVGLLVSVLIGVLLASRSNSH